jgi:methylation protein EvaC
MSVGNIIKPFGLKIFAAEKLNIHGGSMRYYICKTENKFKPTSRFKALLRQEVKDGINKLSTYIKFSKKVKKSKEDLLSLLKSLKKKNKKIISYGATYKSTTVFNYCDIGKNFLDYVTDTTPNKQGKFTPGKHVPIISPKEGFDSSVDYAFLGAWNFKKEIMEKEKKFIKRGGKFITHVPLAKII